MFKGANKTSIYSGFATSADPGESVPEAPGRTLENDNSRDLPQPPRRPRRRSGEGKEESEAGGGREESEAGRGRGGAGGGQEEARGGGSFAGSHPQPVRNHSASAPQPSGRMGSKLGLLLESEDLGGGLVY